MTDEKKTKYRPSKRIKNAHKRHNIAGSNPYVPLKKFAREHAGQLGKDWLKNKK